MSRVFVAMLVAVLLLGAPLAADQALQNPDLEPNATADQTQQQDFIESVGPILDATPIVLALLIVGAILAAVRVVGSG